VIFLSRQPPPGPDRFLHVKLGLLFVGAAVLLFGMTRDNQAAVLVALVLLVPAFLLRFLGRSGEKKAPMHADWYEPDPPADDGPRHVDREGAGDGERDTHEGAAR
jgi:hypothetical protein